MVPLRLYIVWNQTPISSQVSIYQKDGTVAIAHGGVEMGQGINTKVTEERKIVFKPSLHCTLVPGGPSGSKDSGSVRGHDQDQTNKHTDWSK